MLIFSFNKKKAAKLGFIAFFAVFAVGLCAFIGLQQKDGIKTYATCDELGTYSTEAPDEKAQVEFLRLIGVKAEKKPVLTDEVTVPTVFDEVYEKYNELQSPLGLDLSPFKGQEVTRAVYKLKNSGDTATLLIYKGHAVGGHISSGKYGGEYKPLISSR